MKNLKPKKNSKLPPNKQKILVIYAKNNLDESAQYFKVGQSTFRKWLELYKIKTTRKRRDKTSRWNKFPNLILSYSKHNKHPIEDYAPTSYEIVEWNCNVCNYSWDATIRSRTRKINSHCPECKLHLEDKLRASKFIIEANLKHGKRYSYSKIIKIRNLNDTVSIGCDTHGSFDQRAWDHLLGSGCRSCGNISTAKKREDKIIKSGNSFANLHPELLKEWDYDKNDISPDKIAPKSGYVAQWICPLGHQYPAVVSRRTSGNRTGCKKCSRSVSKLEMLVYSYIKAQFSDAQWNIKIENFEVDIHIPSKSVSIEVDGFPWHSTLDKLLLDERKNRFLEGQGLRILRFRERRNQKIDGDVYYFDHDINMDEKIINFIVNFFDISNITDLKKQQSIIWKELINSYPKPPKHKRLTTKFANIGKYWSQNNYADASHYSIYQKDKILMICKKCKKEYERGIPEISEIYMCRPCMYKYGRKTIGTPDKGQSLKDLFPEISKEWSTENEFRPEDYKPGSHFNAIWSCPIHGDYLKEIRLRTRYNNNKLGCSDCANSQKKSAK